MHLIPGGLPAPQACDGVFLFSPHRLRKNLKSLIIVHPSWFIRTVLAISRPFIRWDPKGRCPVVDAIPPTTWFGGPQDSLMQPKAAILLSQPPQHHAWCFMHMLWI